MMKNKWIFGLIVLVIGLSFFSLLKWGVNFPHWDDFAVLQFVNEWEQVEFTALFKFHNEHRIVLTRLSALLINSIFGRLDFHYMMLIGFGFLLGIFLFFSRLAKKASMESSFLLVAALLIFNFSLVENLFWGMAAVQNYAVIFFALLSIFFLTQNIDNKNFVFSVLFAILAILSSGNGILVAPAALIVILFQKRWIAALAWFSILSAVLFLYFQDFVLTYPEKAGPIETARNFIYLLGSFAYPLLNKEHLEFWAIICGLPVLLGLFGFAFTFLRKKHKSSFGFAIFGVLMFLTATLLSVAYSRHTSFTGVLLSSKYKINSFLLLICLLYYAFGLIPNVKIRLAILIVVSGIYLNAQYGYFDNINNTYRERMADLANYEQLQSRESAYKITQHFPVLSSQVQVKNVLQVHKESNQVIFENIADNCRFLLLKNEINSQFLPCEYNYSNSPRAVLSLDYFKTGTYRITELVQKEGVLVALEHEEVIALEGLGKIEAEKNW